ncbi:MAG TPA: NYN domain-containing protein [Candidatus Hydrogenedentes bacterium]|nr:NYN domain-containing protein [Candidatus Hydrogenedentota bacterium]
MPNLYYIDGYNVLHSSSLLRPLAIKDFEAARDALVDKVAAFCVATGKQAVIVFDGRGKHQPERAPTAPHVKGLEILYSPHHLSADAVIERMIYKTHNRLDTVVVSSDQGMRDLCRNMGALTMAADNFLQEVRETRNDTARTLSSLDKKADPPRIEDRLDDSTMARLSALKEKLSK